MLSEEDLQEINHVLDLLWDPIHLYDCPAEERPPAGEYQTYARWIAEALSAGGGKPEILRAMLKARSWMTLDDNCIGDVEAADRILEWRERREES